jgi:sulfite oxidase
MADKHSDFVVRQEKPFNGGSPAAQLRRSFITPGEHFFVRSHAPVPHVDATSYRLAVGGMVRSPMSFSLAELRSRFAPRRLVATLQCAGNRRDELLALGEIPGELVWAADAIGNADWEGVNLRDVLDAAGINLNTARHVEFIGLDRVEGKGDPFGFGASVPIEKAMEGSVLLAWSMNGQPLMPQHGFPLRVVVPGYIGARSVKWLGQIIARDTPSQNYFQSRAYKRFSPDVGPASADWASAPELREIALNSVITAPASGASLPAGEITVQGYAITGDGGGVRRVEVSIDDGQTWIDAVLASENEPWSWRFWSARVRLNPGAHRIICRAWDSHGRTQPRELREVWNFKGYMNNAWHGVEVKAAH